MKSEYAVRMTAEGDENGMQLGFAPKSLTVTGVLADAAGTRGAVLRVLVDVSDKAAAERFFDHDSAVESYTSEID